MGLLGGRGRPGVLLEAGILERKVRVPGYQPVTCGQTPTLCRSRARQNHGFCAIQVRLNGFQVDLNGHSRQKPWFVHTFQVRLNGFQVDLNGSNALPCSPW